MDFDEFVNKAKQLVIDKKITGKNTKRIFLKDIYRINAHESFLKELEKMPSGGAYWDDKMIEHHKQQTLKC
jgi:hypothetical protein